MDAGEIFSAQVRAARGLLGWSQGDLAEKAGLSRTVVARLELGTADSRISSVRAISEAFDKAGAYGIQGRAGRYIPRIEGCYFNVVGLPLARLHALLRGLGWSEQN